MSVYFHALLKSWFLFVEHWSYLGVFLLMALESSIVPVPSEIVMPPAAYWASQGRTEFWFVVLAGTAGSYFGSIVSYWLSRFIGGPLITRYGKYVLLGPKKIAMAEAWVNQFGVGGIFLARLLPVVRHLISIPAGVFRMKFERFSLATLVGAFIWCAVLSWFGRKVIGGSPELLASPEGLISVIKRQLHFFVGAAVALTILYGIVVWFQRFGQKRRRSG